MDIALYILIGGLAALAGYFLAKSTLGETEQDKLQAQAAEIAALQARLRALEEQLGTTQARENQLLTQQEQLRTSHQNEVLQLNRQLAMAQAENQAQQAQLAAQRKDMEEVRAKFMQDFEAISNQVLLKNREGFMQMSKEQIETILKPLSENLKDFGSKVEQNQKEQITQHTQLKEQVRQLSELNRHVSQEAQNLTRALKGENKTMGNWGENILETLLDKAGLLKGQHYEREVTFKDEDGKNLRPDVIVNLPGNKFLVIDSKVSLVAYENYYNSEDPNERKQHLDSHIISIRNHIKGLSEKKYQDLSGIENTPDYVLMFIPLEPAFSLAVQSNAGLFQEALDRNIVLVTTTTLLATLVTVSSIWRQDSQQRNVLEIARFAGKLYDKLADFVADMQKIGRQIKQTQDTYDGAMTKLSGKGSALITAEKIKHLGARASKQIPQEVLDQAFANSGELIEDTEE